MEDFDTSSLIKEYLEDARGHIDRVDAALLDMEKDLGERRELDVELVSNLLGALHTFKGNSGMMGFESLQQYVHQLEGVYKALLEGKAALTGTLMQELFEAAAYIRDCLSLIEKDPKSPPDMSLKSEALRDLLARSEPPEMDGMAGPSESGRTDSYKYIGAKSNTMKVEFERLDHLLNLAGELVTHRTKLDLVTRKFSETYRDKSLSSELAEAAELIHKATSDLQEAIMKARMVPIRQVFQRFPRMVRDLSKGRGKQINLVFEGEATELDKTVIDEIGEPLLHLIRNAVDHGIEAPRERLERSKSPVGEICLSAAQEGSHIIITVSDDGAGMDIDKIRRRAAAFMPEEVLDAMGVENVLDLIFESGFSTADEVTEISGRGVGLDVVKKNIARLGGMVDVQNRPGQGAKFIIRLPLTLAIISALMVRSGTEVYALPLSSVLESIKLDEAEVHDVNGREVIMLRDRVLPLVKLSQVFGDGCPSTPERRYAVIVGRSEKRAGLVVDGLLGRQEIVIKGLANLGDSAGIAGATILGDGKVVLILDVASLMEKNLAVAGGEKP